MDHSIPVFLAAIGIVAGFMVASVFAYLTFRFHDRKAISHFNFMRLGGVAILIFSISFSFSMNWLVGGLGRDADNFTVLGLGIVVAKLILATSSSFLGYILTCKSIKILERSQKVNNF